ncbi:unnamed protein product [Paramecium octaurelia]|uniref:Uncharacterized protein n=1 Tax=Paramecium octaurelia TaxID=43137 RepID=A0A8S1W5D5_PAROT|nr:unnamed protein product [Paramecium octaurelia]
MEQKHLMRYYVEEQQTLHRAAAVYGSGLAMQLNLERNILGAPGQSSYIHLEIAMNKLNDIDELDFMGNKKLEQEYVKGFQQI